MNQEVPDYHKEQMKKSNRGSQKLDRRQWLKKLIKFLVPPALIGTYSKFESNWLELTLTRIPRLNSFKEKRLRILHLSDLHLSGVVDIGDIDRALNVGFRKSPHVCFITGDFITSRPSDQQLGELESCLRKYSGKIPILACLGNHDGGSWSIQKGGFPTTQKVERLLRNARIRLLKNQKTTISINGISFTVYGLGDLWSEDCFPQKCMTKKIPFLKEVKKSKTPPGFPDYRGLPSSEKDTPVKILLCHNPDTRNLVSGYEWDLMLCGHTHGGQFQVPFLNYAPFAPVEDRWVSQGLHVFDGRLLYITRGVGNHYGIRINCRPEVSLLEIS